MTRDDILRMAREADKYADKLEPCWINEYTEIRDQRFAELIEQHLISQGYRKCAEGQRTTQFCNQVEAALAAKREACVNIIETHRIPVGNSAAGELACQWTYEAPHAIRDEIRARNEKSTTGDSK